MKLAKSLLLAASALMFTPEKTEACSCQPYGSILWTLDQIRQNNYVGSVNIAMGQITSINDGYGVSAKILKEYYTYKTLADTVKIWGDPGATCRSSPTAYGSYKVGDSIIYILSSLQFGVQGPDEAADDYSLDCIFSSIRVHNDSVFGGSFIYSPLAMPLSQFLDSMNYLLNAPVVSVPKISKAEESNFIYPNPAQHDFNLLSPSLQAKELLHIFDLNGRLVQNEEVQFESGQAKLHTDLIPGIYAVQLIEQSGNVKTEKLVIDR